MSKVHQSKHWRFPLAAILVFAEIVGAILPVAAGGSEVTSECEEIESFAREGHAIAQYYWAQCLYKGLDGIEVDQARAEHWLQLSAGGGYALAESAIAAIWLFEKKEAKKFSCAIGYLKSAWEKGESQGALNLGFAYLIGVGVPQDSSIAVTWLNNAAEAGNYLANVILYAVYQFGYFGIGLDTKQADLYWSNVELLLQSYSTAEQRQIFEDINENIALSDIFDSQQFNQISSDAIARIDSGSGSEKEVDKDAVRSAVKRLAQFDICPNAELLSLIDVEMAECKGYLERYSSYCWEKLDNLQIDYSVSIDEQGKERLLDIAVVYAACVKSELLLELVASRHNSSP